MHQGNTIHSAVVKNHADTLIMKLTGPVSCVSNQVTILLRTLPMEEVLCIQLISEQILISQ